MRSVAQHCEAACFKLFVGKNLQGFFELHYTLQRWSLERNGKSEQHQCHHDQAFLLPACSKSLPTLLPSLLQKQAGVV